MYPKLRRPSPRLRYFLPPDVPGENGGTGGAGGGTGAPAGAEPPAGGDADKGFPAGTPLEQMTVEQREAYWKHYARQHEQKLRDVGNVDELKRKAAAHDAAEAEKQPELERVRNAAIEDGKAQGRAESQALVAEYAVRGALGHVPAERRDVLLIGVNPTAFVDPTTGRPDEAKISQWVAAVAPNPAAGPPAPGTGPTPTARPSAGTGHGGAREPGSGTTLSAGAQRYREKHGGDAAK